PLGEGRFPGAAVAEERDRLAVELDRGCMEARSARELTNQRRRKPVSDLRDEPRICARFGFERDVLAATIAPERAETVPLGDELVSFSSDPEDGMTVDRRVAEPAECHRKRRQKASHATACEPTVQRSAARAELGSWRSGSIDRRKPREST